MDHLDIAPRAQPGSRAAGGGGRHGTACGASSLSRGHGGDRHRAFTGLPYVALSALACSPLPPRPGTGSAVTKATGVLRARFAVMPAGRRR